MSVWIRLRTIMGTVAHRRCENTCNLTEKQNFLWTNTGQIPIFEFLIIY
jgi:hypothetical protein